MEKQNYVKYNITPRKLWGIFILIIIFSTTLQYDVKQAQAGTNSLDTIFDYTTFTKVDTSNYVTSLSSSNYTITGDNRNTVSQLYRNLGYFTNLNGDYKFRTSVYFISSTSASNYESFWAVTNTIQNTNSLVNAGTISQSAIVRYNGNWYIYFYNDGVGAAGGYTATAGKWYYIEIERLGTTLTMKIYTDTGFTVLVNTQTVTNCDTSTWQYLFAWDAMVAGTSSGLQSIKSGEMSMKYRIAGYDYTTFTQSAGFSGVTAGTYTVSDSGDVVRQLYDDMGPNYFGDNYKFRTSIKAVSSTYSPNQYESVVWAVSNTVISGNDMITVGSGVQCVTLKYTSSSAWIIYLRDNGNSASDIYTVTTGNTVYLEIIRIGMSQTLILNIYSDSAYATLVYTTIISNCLTTSYEYVWVYNGNGNTPSGVTRQSSGGQLNSENVQIETISQISYVTETCVSTSTTTTVTPTTISTTTSEMSDCSTVFSVTCTSSSHTTSTTYSYLTTSVSTCLTSCDAITRVGTTSTTATLHTNTKTCTTWSEPQPFTTTVLRTQTYTLFTTTCTSGRSFTRTNLWTSMDFGTIQLDPTTAFIDQTSTTWIQISYIFTLILHNEFTITQPQNGALTTFGDTTVTCSSSCSTYTTTTYTSTCTSSCSSTSTCTTTCTTCSSTSKTSTTTCTTTCTSTICTAKSITTTCTSTSTSTCTTSIFTSKTTTTTCTSSCTSTCTTSKFSTTTCTSSTSVFTSFNTCTTSSSTSISVTITTTYSTSTYTDTTCTTFCSIYTEETDTTTTLTATSTMTVDIATTTTSMILTETSESCTTTCSTLDISTTACKTIPITDLTSSTICSTLSSTICETTSVTDLTCDTLCSTIESTEISLTTTCITLTSCSGGGNSTVTSTITTGSGTLIFAQGWSILVIPIVMFAGIVVFISIRKKRR